MKFCKTKNKKKKKKEKHKTNKLAQNIKSKILIRKICSRICVEKHADNLYFQPIYLFSNMDNTYG